MPIHPQHADARKLGKRAPRIDPRTFKLSKYLPVLPPVPRRGDWDRKVAAWPMYLNDRLGDCVIAAAAHQIEQWQFYSRETPFLLTDNDVLHGYEAVGGYVPGNPNTDNGVVILDMLNYWRHTGFGINPTHRIVAYAAVNWKSYQEVATAIMLFGSVICGFALPVSAQGEMLWTVPPGGAVGDGSWGSWGGHCVPLTSWDRRDPSHVRFDVITWGDVYKATGNFLHSYCDEMYAVVSQDWINAQGKSPSGFDMDALLADLAAL